MMFQASEFHLGVDVVEMYFFDLCNYRMCICIPGWFPVPVDDGSELGLGNPQAECQRVVVPVLPKVPWEGPLENLFGFPKVGSLPDL